MYDREAMRIGIQQFWDARHEARNRQRGGNEPDRGNRRSVTSGTHLDGVLDALIAMIAADGVVDEAQVIRRRRVAVLPGYYLPEKEWDLILPVGRSPRSSRRAQSAGRAVVRQQFQQPRRGRSAPQKTCGPLTARRVRRSACAWLGYLFILEDHPASTRPVQVREPLYSVFPEFANTSYAQRYEAAAAPHGARTPLQRRRAAALQRPRRWPGLFRRTCRRPLTRSVGSLPFGALVRIRVSPCARPATSRALLPSLSIAARARAEAMGSATPPSPCNSAATLRNRSENPRLRRAPRCGGRSRLR